MCCRRRISGAADRGRATRVPPETQAEETDDRMADQARHGSARATSACRPCHYSLSNTSIVDNCIVTYRTNDRIVFTRLTGRASSHRFIEESQANNSHTPTAVHSPFVVRGTAVDRPSIRHGHLCTRIPMHSIFDWLFIYHADTSPSVHPCIPPQFAAGI